MNELLWILLMVVTYGSILLAYRLFGKTGLYVWIGLSVIVANIQVVKTVEIFGLTATLGNAVYASSFLATDILSEYHGVLAARRGVLLGFFAIVSMTVLMLIALAFTPAEVDFAQSALERIFLIVPRITAASLVAYLVSQFHDVWAFDAWKRLFPGRRFLWVRNNASTIVSQLIDSVIFTLVAFTGVFEPTLLLEILLTTWLFKVIAAVCDTPFVYLASRR
jgi:queuosine precursor transporter